MHFRFRYYDTIGSTNTEAADEARRGAEEGLCVVADEQTAGRGRQGREWTSRKGSGLYMSIVLRPKVGGKHLTLIPLLAAVAVHDVLKKQFLLRADIKWPNDILIDEKKICGILAEAIDTPGGLAVILGIGINLRNGHLPENATSVESELASPCRRDEIIAALTSGIEQLHRVLHSDPSAIIDQWKVRSSYFEGKLIEVRSGGEILTGVTCGLEENGALRVRIPDGSTRVIQAGDVQQLRAAH